MVQISVDSSCKASKIKLWVALLAPPGSTNFKWKNQKSWVEICQPNSNHNQSDAVALSI